MAKNHRPAAHPSLEDEVIGFLAEWYEPEPLISLQTSGSTGAPKTIRLPKAAMEASARMTGQFFGLEPGMRAHLCLSPGFIAGKMMIVRALVLGLELITTRVEANPLQDLEDPIDFSAMVPLQLARVLQQDPGKLDLICILLLGGGPLSPALEEALQARKTACWHTYGMTETMTHIALRAVNGPERSSWFRPLAGVQPGTDQRGCLVIEAPAIIPGAVVTNDLVELRENRFRVLGRLDDVIISSGRKLHPALIEQKIGRFLNLPFFLAPRDHPRAGQIPVLLIEGQPDETEERRLMQELGRQLEAYESPRRIYYLDQFRYLASGKIDRTATLSLLDDHHSYTPNP